MVTFDTPFTCTFANKVNFKWTDVEQKAIDEIKHIFSHDNLLAYIDDLLKNTKGDWKDHLKYWN